MRMNTNRDAVEVLVRSTTQRFGHVDGLIHVVGNVAGSVPPLAPFKDLDLAVIGWTTKTFLPLRLKHHAANLANLQINLTRSTYTQPRGRRVTRWREMDRSWYFILMG